MSRLARIVVPGLPHLVTQRGNGRDRVFFQETDYSLYRDLLAAQCRASGVGVLAWCLMPNHVHLVLVPADPDALRRTLAIVHRCYAGLLHSRRGRTGHFWQGRFGCVAMDAAHFGVAVRHVALNPVRAGLVKDPADWPWSSVRSQLMQEPDGVTTIAATRERIGNFGELLAGPEDSAAVGRLRRAELIGRPVGDEAFLACLEVLLRRTLRPKRRGPKPGWTVDRRSESAPGVEAT